MTPVQSQTLVETILHQRCRLLAMDLLQCLDQKLNTTKHSRREKAFAYLLETMTGHPDYKVSQEEAEQTLVLLGQLLANVKSSEAKVSYERAEARLRWLLDHPENFKGQKQCVACGELYQGANHICTNQTAKSKDALMAKDDTLL